MSFSFIAPQKQLLFASWHLILCPSCGGFEGRRCKTEEGGCGLARHVRCSGLVKMKYPTKSIAAGQQLQGQESQGFGFCSKKNMALWPRSSTKKRTAKNMSRDPGLSSHDAAGLSPGEAEIKSWPGDYPWV